MTIDADLGDEAEEDIESYLIRMCGELGDDPLGWIMWAFPWGEMGTALADVGGPDQWQINLFEDMRVEIQKNAFNGFDPVDPLRYSIASGHGIGKSAAIAMLIMFIASTRPNCRGTVTANTGAQLQTKTWAELAKWKKMAMTGHWFKINSGRGSLRLAHRSDQEEWFVNGIQWQEKNATAFQGQHARTSTSFYIYDEGSGIPRTIFEAGQGGLTDGEPMEFIFGNPNESSGYFYDTHNHDRIKKIYKRFQIDSRTARFTNKRQIQQWIDLYGIDSDFVKIRVLGQFPRLAAQQLIPTDHVERAADLKREPVCDLTDPIIFGLDVARNGDCESVLYIRKGRDGRTHKMMIHRGDTELLARKVANLAKELMPDAIFVDGGGVGGPVVDRLRSLNIPNVIEVLFGAASPDADYGNMAAYMWCQARDALAREGHALHDDYDLKSQLYGRKYFTAKDKIWLVPKEVMISDGDPSPDRADAYCLTFSMPVGPRDISKTKAAWSAMGQHESAADGNYDPYR